VVENIKRKDAQHAELSAAMMAQMTDYMNAEIFGAEIQKTFYTPTEDIIIPKWIRS
jgi:hypothetical protein